LPERTVLDLGSLLLTFVLLWGYLAFSQYLVTWSGNLPNEIDFYRERGHGAWRGVGLALVVLHFALPFAVLLSHAARRSAAVLAVVAGGLIVLRFVDVARDVVPVLGATIHWTFAAAIVGIGGTWAFAFLRALDRNRVPVGGADAVRG